MEGGRTGDLLDGEEGGKAVRGKKSHDRRCGKTIEAEPVAGQTCLIEPAQGALAKADKGRGNGWKSFISGKKRGSNNTVCFAKYLIKRIGRCHVGPNCNTIGSHADRTCSHSQEKTGQRGRDADHAHDCFLHLTSGVDGSRSNRPCDQFSAVRLARMTHCRR